MWASLLEVEPSRPHVAREIDGAEIAHRRLAAARDLQNLRAQVRQMHGIARLRRLVAGAVGFVLERHPAVTGLRQRAHHAQVQIARAQRLLARPLRFGLDVGVVERLAEQIGQQRHVLGIEQRPRAVFLDPAHEQIRNPVGEVQVVCATGFVAGVVAQFQERFDVGMPGFEIRAGGAFATSSLIYRGNR